jgi:hypothetical protein
LAKKKTFREKKKKKKASLTMKKVSKIEAEISQHPGHINQALHRDVALKKGMKRSSSGSGRPEDGLRVD